MGSPICPHKDFPVATGRQAHSLTFVRGSIEKILREFNLIDLSKVDFWKIKYNYYQFLFCGKCRMFQLNLVGLINSTTAISDVIVCMHENQETFTFTPMSDVISKIRERFSMILKNIANLELDDFDDKKIHYDLFAVLFCGQCRLLQFFLAEKSRRKNVWDDIIKQ